MTDRYFAWRGQDWGGWQDRPTSYVHEADPTPVKTGILDQHGVPLYRVPDRVPLGFDLTVKEQRR